MLRRNLNKLLIAKTFLTINVLVFIAKIIYSFQNNFKTNYFEDWSVANNLVKHGVYSEFIEVGSTAYKLPVYPFFLAAIMYLFPKNSFEGIIIIQHLIYFFIPVLFLLISRMLKMQKTGILTGYLFILSPAYFFYSNVIEATNVFIPILLLWIYFYLKMYLGVYKNNLILVLFSFTTALLLLTQVVIAPLAFVLILYLLVSKKTRLQNWIFMVLLAAVFYSPWVIRNYLVFHKFIPTKTPVWQNIYFSYTSEVNILDEVKLISDQHQRSTFQQRKHVSEFEMEKVYKTETLKAIEGKNSVVLLKMVQNTVLLWYVPSRYFYDNSLKIVLGRKVFVCLLNIFTIFSLVFLWNNNKKLFYLSLLVFVNFTLPYTVGHAANTRFKLDFEWFQYFIVSYMVVFRLNKNQIG